MNTSEFHGSTMEKDPQDLIDEIHKVTHDKGIIAVKSSNLASYQMKGVAQTWCK